MTSAIANLNDADEILKDYYTDTEVWESINIENPVLAALPQRTDMKGRRSPLPLMISPTAGVSPTFATAQANKAATEYEAFMVEPYDLFSLFSVDHKAATMAKDDGSFEDYVIAQSEGAMVAWKNLFARYMFGNGGGALAEIESGGGTDTLTLTRRSDVHTFFKNMWVQSSTDDGDRLGASAGVLGPKQQITEVSRRARTITQAGTWDATHYAAGNFIFIAGGYGNVFDGFSSWTPTSVSPGESFNNVDRSTDDMLVGVYRVADSAQTPTVYKFMLDLISDVRDMGGKPTMGIANGLTINQVVKELDNKVEYVFETIRGSDGKPIANVGFDTVQFVSGGRRFAMIEMKQCPRDEVHVLTPETWRFWSAGKLVGFTEYGDDKNRYLRHTNENAMEGRIHGYVQQCCRMPSWNGRGNIADLIDTDEL